MAAPVLRGGVGTSKGACLKLSENSTGTMEWQGRMFPRSSDGDKDTPEALPAQDGVLPHLHGDYEDRFPRAEACSALKDDDPADNEDLESRGEAIGVGLGTSCGERSKDNGRNNSVDGKVLHGPECMI